MSDNGRSAHPLTVLGLIGSEREMGRQHGQLSREVGGWEAAVEFYGGMPARILGAGRRDRGRTLIVKALQPLLKAGLARLDRARPAHLRARTEAFMAALGRPASDRHNVFVLDVAQNAVGVLARCGLMHDVQRLAAPGACSSFACWGEASSDGRLLHGRNFDLPGIGIWERAPTVVFCRPTDAASLRYGFIATRGADVPGVTAFNETGIVVSAHTRFHRNVTFDGLGVVDLGHLIASRATSLADAVAIASEQRIASSWGIVVSSARERRALVIETHAGRIAVHRPRPGASHLVATNRNRVAVMQPGEIAPSPAWVRYSDGREAAMERRLAGATGLPSDGSQGRYGGLDGNGSQGRYGGLASDGSQGRYGGLASDGSQGRYGGLDVADAMALLSSHEAGDVPGWERSTGDCLAQSITVQSVVVDAERQAVWVSVGEAPTSKGPWICVPWHWDHGAAEAQVIEAPPRIEVPESARDAAYRAYVEAARLEGHFGTEASVEAAIARALALQPADPSYRHLAGGLALRAGRPDDALAHFEVALTTERSSFRTGELHRWAHQAATWTGQKGRAREHRQTLLANDEPALAEAKAAVDKPLTRRRHREIGIDFQLLTLST